jgi:AraC family transcriptional regulator
MMLDKESYDLSVAAAQLAKSVCHTRNGNDEAVNTHLAHAKAILYQQTASLHLAALLPRKPAQQIVGLAAWKARKVAAHVDANLGGKIHIEDLAELVSFSLSHFSRAFKRTFGITAHAWLMRRRIEVAQELLLTTDFTLSEIALRCGMADQSHFTHRFLRLVGETPSSWRRTRLEALEEQGKVGTVTRAAMSSL